MAIYIYIYIYIVEIYFPVNFCLFAISMSSHSFDGVLLITTLDKQEKKRRGSRTKQSSQYSFSGCVNFYNQKHTGHSSMSLMSFVPMPLMSIGLIPQLTHMQDKKIESRFFLEPLLHLLMYYDFKRMRQRSCDENSFILSKSSPWVHQLLQVDRHCFFPISSFSVKLSFFFFFFDVDHF